MEQAMTGGRRSGWSEAETRMLWETADEAQQQGLPLRAVFERIAEQTGRRPNSIRNYYYAQVRERGEGQQPPARFVPFAPEEVDWLMEQVLVARAAGQSVRSCLQKLAGGDHSLMLRYQNKYPRRAQEPSGLRARHGRAAQRPRREVRRAAGQPSRPAPTSANRARGWSRKGGGPATSSSPAPVTRWQTTCAGCAPRPTRR